MGNWEHFVYGKKRFSDILMGLSLASTWAWEFLLYRHANSATKDVCIFNL